MSDIYVKTTTTTGWKKAINIFVKTTTTTGWKAALGVWIKTATQWIKVWPLSGVFSTRSAWVGPNSDTLYADRLTSSSRIRIGSNYYGNNAQWDPNGWTITSYSYAWQYYDTNDGFSTGTTFPGESGTGSGWTSGGTGQDVLPLATWTSTTSTNTDRKYLRFEVTANASNSTYSGKSNSPYIQIIRRVPQYTGSPSLSTNSPQEGTSITYTAPTWDTTEARKAESYRTTIYWYTNSTSTTTGGTYVGNGSSYTPVSGDIGKYIYAVETRYNSGTDYDLGPTTGVEAKVVTTSAVSAGLTPPTSVSVSSVSRYSNTETLVTLSHSGGSGPYYQMYWVASSTTPTTASYDAASNTSSSSISEAFSFAHNTTYYFYVRSSSQNIATTFTNGTATAGTYSAYSNISPANPSYTFQQPSGSVSVSPSSGTAGTTQFTASASVSAAPTATVSYQWLYNEGGSFGYQPISGATSSTYTPPSNYVTLYGSSLKCRITANNGVGTELVAESSVITVNAPLTKLSTPTNVNATDTRTDGVNVTWTAVSGAAYYGVWYGPTPSYDSLADFGGNRNTTLITGTSYLDTSIGAGVTRDYYVQAYRSGDPTGTKSEWGGPNSGTRLEVVNAPTNATIPTLSPTSIAVGTQLTAGVGTWNNNPTSYDLRIYRGTAGVLTSETLVASTTSSTTLNYTVTLSDYNSGQRYFRTYVNASNSGGSSGFVAGQERGPIAAPATAPTAPTSLTATTNRSDGVNLTFSGATGQTSYEIFWNVIASGTPSSASSADFSNVSSPYLDTGIGSGSTRYYWVRARNSNGTSAWYPSGNGVTGTRTSGVSIPATPTGVGLSGSGSVSWTASTGATSYEIEFYTAQNGTGLNAAPTGSSGYTVTGISSSPYQLTSPYASPNNWARVRVRARNSAGASSYSAWVPSATTYT